MSALQIVYHIGANCTDDDRLLKSLLKNADAFSAQGIKVPGPGKYRRLIRETIQSLDGRRPPDETRDILLDAFLDDEEAERLVMSHSEFICVPNRIFQNGRFYELAAFKVASLAQLFPDDEIEIHLALRDPATFIPATFAISDSLTLEDFLKGFDPLHLQWSDLVARIQSAVPDGQITVWCNEDTPLIWSQLIRELSGVDPNTPIVGGYDLLSAIMRPEGMKRFLSYTKANPPQTEEQKRRIIAAFLDKYALEDEVEEEVDIEGWTNELVGALMQNYEADVAKIEKMPGVVFVAP